jgi:hypothetical protein
MNKLRARSEILNLIKTNNFRDKKMMQYRKIPEQKGMYLREELGATSAVSKFSQFQAILRANCTDKE